MALRRRGSAPLCKLVAHVLSTANARIFVRQHIGTFAPRSPSAHSAAEGVKQAAKIGAAVVGAGIGAFLTKQLAAKRQSAAIIELSNLLVRLGGESTSIAIRNCAFG